MVLPAGQNRGSSVRGQCWDSREKRAREPPLRTLAELPSYLRMGTSAEPPRLLSHMGTLSGGGLARVMQGTGAPPDALPRALPLASVPTTGSPSTLSSRSPL